jgi:RNA polymerase sigma-54 factor
MLQLRQSQSLQQRLTPQQVQYLKLLQLPIISLEQRIKSELEENPMLEEVSEDDESLEQPTSDSTDAATAEVEHSPVDEPISTASLADDVVDPDARRKEAEEQQSSADDANEYSFEDYMNDDLEGFKSPNASNVGNDEDREEMPHAATQTFIEALYAQVTMLNLPDRIRALAEEIIGSIDEDGYLRVPLQQIVNDASIFYDEEYTLQEAEALLHRLQKLDPPGVAARDLRECLLVQLDMMSNHNPTREVARKILAERFDDFVNKRYTALARHLGTEPHDLKPAIDLIQKLNPKPGATSGLISENTNYITADFYIEKTQDGKDFLITLNERGVPPLRVNASYKELVRKQPNEQGKAGANSTRLTPEAKDFIKKKFEAAKFFILAIYQRRETMMRVMQSIVKHQHAFFVGGEKFLKPLIYKTIAEDINMDISTICRVVNGKYCQTDHGIFELKYFFSEAIPTEGGEGEAVANKVVKSRIKDIIDAEDGGDPLSDEKIVQLLNQEGFDVARRTVAKYREQMNIPVARLRKKLV